LPPEREALLKRIAASDPSAWPMVEKGMRKALKEYSEHGFCAAINVNHSGINAVSTPLSSGGTLYAITCAAPAILAPAEQLLSVIGPALVKHKLAIQSRLP
jgi:DNA-binding IclR family transcriptional regulator